MSRVSKGRLNGYYVTKSPMWEMGCKLNPNLYSDYKDFLSQPASKKDIDLVLKLVWLDVRQDIVWQKKTMEKYQGLPPEVAYSFECMCMLFKRPELIPAVHDGIITAYMLRRMFKMEDIYK